MERAVIVEGGDLCAEMYRLLSMQANCSCSVQVIFLAVYHRLSPKQLVGSFYIRLYQYSGFLSVCLTVQQPLSRILSAVIEQIWNRIGDMGTAADWRRMIRHN